MNNVPNNERDFDEKINLIKNLEKIMQENSSGNTTEYLTKKLQKIQENFWNTDLSTLKKEIEKIITNKNLNKADVIVDNTIIQHSNSLVDSILEKAKIVNDCITESFLDTTISLCEHNEYKRQIDDALIKLKTYRARDIFLILCEIQQAVSWELEDTKKGRIKKWDKKFNPNKKKK